MNLDIAEVSAKMYEAAETVIGDDWPRIKSYFESETRVFAERLASIAKMRASGEISEARAISHLEFQKEAWETFLLSVRGMNQLMVEEALNAALDAVKDIVNTTIGFALL